MSNFWDSDPVAVPAKGSGNFWDSDPVATAPPDLGENRSSLVAALRGIPVAGAGIDKATAALNAAAQPITETGLSHAPTFSERMAENEARVKAGTDIYEKTHPIGTTAGKVAMGTLATVPLMMAAPEAFGLAGTLPQMVGRGALSNAALSGADAAIRGEDPTTAAAIGGAMGAAAPLVARGVGRGIQAVRDYRNPAPIVPQNLEKVAGVDVPLTTGQATADPAVQAEEEIMRRGGRGQSAEEIAKQADQQAQTAVSDASANIAKSLDSTGTNLRTAPQEAGGTIQSELTAQEQARQAAAQAQALQVGAEGESLARGLGGGTAPVSTLDAAEGTGAAVAQKAAQGKAATQAAYKARDAIPGTFDESYPKGLAENLRERLNTGENPIWVDPTNESTANKALKLIDQTLGKDSGIFANSAAPRTAEGVKAAAPAEDETVAALRKKFGDNVANAYVKQTAKTASEDSIVAATQRKANELSSPMDMANEWARNPDAVHAKLDSLVQDVRQTEKALREKYGVKKTEDLEDAPLTNEERHFLFHSSAPTDISGIRDIRSQLQPIDSLNEASTEIAYELRRLPKDVNNMNTAESLAAMRLQVLFHEVERLGGNLNNVIKDAGKKYAAKFSDPEDAGFMAESAAERLRNMFSATPSKPVERLAIAPPKAEFQTPPTVIDKSPSVDLRTMDEARKRLVTMYSDAKSAAIRSGDRSDLRAMAKILDEFDNSISDAMASGKFSGDAETAMRLQAAARKSHSEYKQAFSSRGPGDEVGRSIEKILGKYTDTAATPDEIASVSYGPKGEPGGGKAERVAVRLKKILGSNSPEWGQYKQGLFAHVMGDESLSPAEKAARIDKFLTGRGKGLANVALEPAEKRALTAHSANLKGIEPAAKPTDRVGKALGRITGADGHPPATSNEVVDTLFSRSAKGDGLSTELAAYLKKNLSPESWSKLKQGAWEHLVTTPEGAKDLTSAGIAKRLSAYLDGDLSKILNTPEELAEMRKLMMVHNKLTPLPGTTNPSGSAFFGQKMLKSAGRNVMTMLGFAHGNVGGAIVGHGLDSLRNMVQDARAGKQATQLFFGKQAKTAAPVTRIPQLLAPAVSASQR